MDFGKIIKVSGANGTITLPTTGTITSYPTGFQGAPGSQTEVPELTISGSENTMLTITVPQGVTIGQTGDGLTVNINTSDSGNIDTTNHTMQYTIPVGGTGAIKFGGDLVVASSSTATGQKSGIASYSIDY